MENVVTFVTTKQKGMENKTVKFRVEMEHPLPIPGETCTVTFIGRATVTFNAEETFLAAEVTALWLGVDVPNEHNFSWNFRNVAVPEKNHENFQLNLMLKGAALDAFVSPEAITLPDEKCSPLTNLVSFLKPHPIVS